MIHEPAMTPGNTTVYVIDPHMRECSKEQGEGTDETEAAVDRIATLVPLFRKAGVPVVFVWSMLDETQTIQLPQDLPGDAPPYKRLTTCIETSLGGIHPKIKPLLRASNRVHHKFTECALSVPAIREHIHAQGPAHAILLGFNTSRCLTEFGVSLRTDKELPRQNVVIFSDASGDSHRIAMEEMRDDSGIGESFQHARRRYSGVRSEKSHISLERLGIGTP